MAKSNEKNAVPNDPAPKRKKVQKEQAAVIAFYAPSAPSEMAGEVSEIKFSGPPETPPRPPKAKK